MAKIFLPTFLLILSFHVHGQHNFLTIQGGPGLGWISGNEYSSENQSMRSLPVIGVEFSSNLNEKTFVTIGVDFMKKGAWDLGIREEVNQMTVVTNSYTSDYKYVVLPMMIHRSFGSEKVMFTAGTGLFLGVLLQHQDEVNTGVFNIRLIEEDTDEYQMLDAGWQVRLGMRVKINDTHYFMLNLNHQMGLLNTTSKNLTDGGALRTNASFVQAGFGFVL